MRPSCIGPMKFLNAPITAYIISLFISRGFFLCFYHKQLIGRPYISRIVWDRPFYVLLVGFLRSLFCHFPEKKKVWEKLLIFFLWMQNFVSIRWESVNSTKFSLRASTQIYEWIIQIREHILTFPLLPQKTLDLW